MIDQKEEADLVEQLTMLGSPQVFKLTSALSSRMRDLALAMQTYWEARPTAGSDQLRDLWKGVEAKQQAVSALSTRLEQQINKEMRSL
jgi:hypothetical protein